VSANVVTPSGANLKGTLQGDIAFDENGDIKQGGVALPGRKDGKFEYKGSRPRSKRAGRPGGATPPGLSSPPSNAHHRYPPAAVANGSPGHDVRAWPWAHVVYGIIS
jgi:hypothetical protein